MPDERETTALMRRDELLSLVNATSTPAVSAHTLPRVLLDRRVPASSQGLDEAPGSPWLVLAIIGVLIAIFIAIVATAS